MSNYAVPIKRRPNWISFGGRGLLLTPTAVDAICPHYNPRQVNAVFSNARAWSARAERSYREGTHAHQNIQASNDDAVRAAFAETGARRIESVLEKHGFTDDMLCDLIHRLYEGVRRTDPSTWDAQTGRYRELAIAHAHLLATAEYADHLQGVVADQNLRLEHLYDDLEIHR